MSTKMELVRDINGYVTFGIDFAADNFNTTLAANTAQTFTCPSNYPNWEAIISISPGANIFIAKNTTATVAGATVASSASQLNPVARSCKAGDTLSVITADTSNPYVNVSFYVVSPGPNV